MPPTSPPTSNLGSGGQKVNSSKPSYLTHRFVGLLFSLSTIHSYWAPYSTTQIFFPSSFFSSTSMRAPTPALPGRTRQPCSDADASCLARRSFLTPASSSPARRGVRRRPSSRQAPPSSLPVEPPPLRLYFVRYGGATLHLGGGRASLPDAMMTASLPTLVPRSWMSASLPHARGRMPARRWPAAGAPSGVAAS